MSEFSEQKQWKWIALAVVALAVAPVGAEVAEDAATEAPVEEQTLNATEQGEAQPALPAMASGQRIFIDPATGRRVVPDAATRARAHARTDAMLSRSSDGLFETASPSSGVMVNLLGRFRTATTVTLAEEGPLEAQCIAEPEDSGVATTQAEPVGGVE